ncbi:MAG: 3-methyl-2-oxobutanoate hydroxymethyltransferase [Alphaproteobacteria bacterium]|nr:3-methyl-2-oxobutanoate hydroxymethyltransferase [Alphaproteobacteria bacterium]
MTSDSNRITIEDIRSAKGRDEPLVCLTAYTARVAQILDQYCDLLLVGDSMGMVLYGMEGTRGVTLDMIINHGQAIMRGSKRACVVLDMPFGTYEDDPANALKNAKRLMNETGASAVKLEGGADLAPTIKHIVDAGIPVMAHIGLLPQSVEEPGGFRVQGKTEDTQEQLLQDARAVEQAGAFAMVIEATLDAAADKITQAVSIPTIGIGASPNCDGQILVTEDMLGITGDYVPKFVKQYANMSEIMDDAAKHYAQEVRTRRFPAKDHLYTLSKKAS